MSRPLWEKLQSLQCHFTWDFEIKDKVDVMHILTTLALRIKHTGYRNRGIYLAMRAYLQHLEGQDKEALGTLRDAEEALKEEHPSDFSRQVLVTYGNYAWVYYHLSNYEMVERYLGQIREICQSLASPQPYLAAIPETRNGPDGRTDGGVEAAAARRGSGSGWRRPSGKGEPEERRPFSRNTFLERRGGDDEQP
nr:interferon-induced protein with tetratricopeptide repeats 5-like [Pogona vitticeps]